MAGNASLAVRHGPFAEALLSSAKVLFEGSWGINSAKDNEAFAEGRRVSDHHNTADAVAGQGLAMAAPLPLSVSAESPFAFRPQMW